MARSTIVRHETAVGAFALLVVSILAAGLIIKGAKVGFGSRHFTFTAKDGGHDLKKGAAVKMQGIEIGEVTGVDLEPTGVHVHAKVYPEFGSFVHRDAVARIAEPPIIGSTSVEVEPGKTGDIEEGETLKYEEKPGLLSKFQGAEGEVDKIVKKANDIADKADHTLDTVNQVLDRVNAGQGIVGRLVKDEKLSSDFSTGVEGMIALVDDVKNGRGAFALLKDEQLAPDIKQAVADVRSMTDAVARGDGSLGRLMTHDDLVVQGEKTLQDVRAALARLDEIATQTTKTTEKVQQVLDEAKGTLAKLDGTIKNAEKTTGQLAELTEKVNKGQGSLAKIVNDDALFRETKALLKELRESVEDLREQAPINSFIGVVFSAF